MSLASDFLVTSFHHDGNCTANNLFAYGITVSPSCATAKPADKLDGSCVLAGGKQMPNDYNTNLCVKKDYDFVGQLVKSLGSQDFIILQGFENDSKCSDQIKTTAYYALTFKKGLNLNLPIEEWSPNGLQFSRVTGDASNVNVIGLDGKVVKTIPVDICVTVSTGSYILAFPDLTNAATTTTASGARPTNAPISDIGGPCKQAIPNPAVCKAGLVCIPPAIALPGAPGTCQAPFTSTSTSTAASKTTSAVPVTTTRASGGNSLVASGFVAMLTIFFA
ncbi:hypothetical protein HDU79_008523 [Rhizoclosmatium sp. JEL0117]|nr:hypothetical protein HDU79_008523 [Rhizoclosmatium sp. JEL0117]